MSILQRFWSNIVITDGCWLWKGYINKDGYGRFKIKNRHYMVHRFSYERYKEEIPEGLEIDHLCRHRNCVNPEHLEAVTHLENIRRGDLSYNGALNRNKVYCLHGHEFNEVNTYYRPNGKRNCRECHKLLERYRRNKRRVL